MVISNQLFANLSPVCWTMPAFCGLNSSANVASFLVYPIGSNTSFGQELRPLAAWSKFGCGHPSGFRQVIEHTCSKCLTRGSSTSAANADSLDWPLNVGLSQGTLQIRGLPFCAPFSCICQKENTPQNVLPFRPFFIPCQEAKQNVAAPRKRTRETRPNGLQLGIPQLEEVHLTSNNKASPAEVAVRSFEGFSAETPNGLLPKP